MAFDVRAHRLFRGLRARRHELQIAFEELTLDHQTRRAQLVGRARFADQIGVRSKMRIHCQLTHAVEKSFSLRVLPLRRSPVVL